MTAEAPVLRKPGNAYNIFILVLTIFSLVIMVLLLLPVTPAERDLLTLYDNAVCVIFLIDFAMNLAGAKPKRAYFIGQRGWLDLLGSIPTLRLHPDHGAVPPRPPQPAGPDHPPAARPGRQGPRPRRARQPRPVRDVHHDPAGRDRAQRRRASSCSSSRAGTRTATSQTGGDAIWWGLVTITTVGYGDFYPVTTFGRLTGIFVMFAGIGIIGALASILASLLVSPSTPDEPAPEAAPSGTPDSPTTADAVVTELAGLRAEIAALRSELHPGQG